MDHEQIKSIKGDGEKMIRLELDSEPLWQWDTGRRLILTDYPAGTIVDFIQFGFQTRSAIAQEHDGIVFVWIPNEMLHHNTDLRVYIRQIQGDDTQTLLETSFPVLSRPKPADYIASESEILTWKKLEKRVSKLEEIEPVQYTAQDLTPEQQAQARDNIHAQEKGDYLTVESDPTVPEWAKQPMKPAYTAQEVGADPIGIAAEMVNAHNNQPDAHLDIRLLIQQLTQRLDTIANSDDVSLDQLHEIVTYIKDNRDLIEQVTTGKISVTDIVNDLTTDLAGKPLSAAMGVELKRLIDTVKVPASLSELTEDPQHRTVTDAEKEKWNSNKPAGDCITSEEFQTGIQNAEIKVVDKLAPAFHQKASMAQGELVAGYPLGVRSYLEHWQEGSGDPSPENVRPIHGWCSLELTVTNTPDAVKPSDQHTQKLPEEIFGGVYDWKSGELSVSYTSETFMGAVTENWFYTESSKRFGIQLKNPLPATERRKKVLCNIGTFRENGYDSGTAYIFGTTFYYHTDQFKSVEEFKNWLAERPLMVVYAVNQNVTIPLTPEPEILALEGVTTLYSNAGDTEVVGRTDPNAVIAKMQQDIAALQDAIVKS